MLSAYLQVSELERAETLATLPLFIASVQAASCRMPNAAASSTGVSSGTSIRIPAGEILDVIAFFQIGPETEGQHLLSGIYLSAAGREHVDRIRSAESR